MASGAHSATVTTEPYKSYLPTKYSCGLCKEKDLSVLSGSLGSLKITYVEPGALRPTGLVHLSCDPNRPFHKKCIEEWFLKNKMCPLHNSEVTFESRVVQQIPLHDASPEEALYRSDEIAESQLKRSGSGDLYGSAESSEDLYA